MKYDFFKMHEAIQNKQNIAEVFGCSRQYVYTLMKKYKDDLEFAAKVNEVTAKNCVKGNHTLNTSLADKYKIAYDEYTKYVTMGREHLEAYQDAGVKLKQVHEKLSDTSPIGKALMDLVQLKIERAIVRAQRVKKDQLRRLDIREYIFSLVDMV